MLICIQPVTLRYIYTCKLLCESKPLFTYWLRLYSLITTNITNNGAFELFWESKCFENKPHVNLNVRLFVAPPTPLTTISFDNDLFPRLNPFCPIYARETASVCWQLVFSLSNCRPLEPDSIGTTVSSYRLFHHRVSELNLNSGREMWTVLKVSLET